MSTGKSPKTRPRLFAVGDVVQLRSGGRLMTVHAADPTDPWVWCVWQTVHGEPRDGWCHRAALVQVPDSPAGETPNSTPAPKPSESKKAAPLLASG
jgi:uncharacterized protein YodC (DUF2158 family)